MVHRTQEINFINTYVVCIWAHAYLEEEYNILWDSWVALVTFLLHKEPDMLLQHMHNKCEL